MPCCRSVKGSCFSPGPHDLLRISMSLTQRITDQGGPIPSGDAVAGLVPDGGLILESSGRVVAISPGAVSMLGRSITGLSEVLQDDDDFPRARVLEALLRANDAWAQTT